MEEWISKSRPIIRRILTESIPTNLNERERNADMDIVNTITNDTYMQYWVIAFTHESVDPNPSSNYEPFEILGDKVLGLQFTTLVQQAYRAAGKEAEPGRITELLSDIMNSKYQEKLSQEWKLMDLLLTNAPMMKKSGSDIFESFFGMLQYIGDLMGRGVGYIWTFNVLARMLSNVDFVNHVIDQPRVFVNEVFTRYGATSIKPITAKTTTGYEAHFEIPANYAMQWGLTRSGPWNQYKQTGKTKVMAVDMAYKNLANELKKRGVTTRTDSLFTNLWKDPIVADMYRKALNKREYVDFRINSFEVANGAYLQLIGIDTTGYRVVINAKDYPTTNIDATRAKELLQGYVG